MADRGSSIGKVLLAGFGFGLPLFLLLRRRTQGLGLGRRPERWWEKRAPSRGRACYPTKTDALNAFLDWNRDVVEAYGGVTYQVSPAEFDTINHKYGLRGKKAVRTIADAVWVAMPAGRPFCLDRIDIDALNSTSPARQWEDVYFKLPDYVYEAQAAEEEARYYSV